MKPNQRKEKLESTLKFAEEKLENIDKQIALLNDQLKRFKKQRDDFRSSIKSLRKYLEKE